MSLLGSRGIVRASKVPTCQRQAAIVADGAREEQLYESYTGEPYPAEYGERNSARRRGSAFERSAYDNDAAGLRHSLGPRFGHDPDRMWVRNLEDECPWPRDQAHALRLSRTLGILGDLSQGKRVPELLIQPQVRLTIREEVGYRVFITPDALVLDPDIGIYVPVEPKSFAERDGVTARADLDGTRRQAGVEVRALQETAGRHGLSDRVQERAILVFATPYGLQLGPPHLESVRSSCREVDRAVALVAAMHQRLEELRSREGEVQLQNLLDDFEVDYTDACHGSCVFAARCRSESEQTARLLGDEAAELIGAEMPLERILALAAGDAPLDASERAVQADLIAGATHLDELERRVA